MKYRENKFTLIEVLVVVAIIGILASLLLPSFNNVREKSRASVCKGNLKQLATTMFIYHDDNENIMRYVTPHNNGGNIPWSRSTVFPGDNSILNCPSDENSNPNQWAPSYGFNYWNLSDKKLNSVTNLAETLFFADSGREGEVHPYTTRVAPGYHINKTTTNPAPIGIRHNYKPNLLWVDGHVSTLKDLVGIHISDEFWDRE